MSELRKHVLKGNPFLIESIFSPTIRGLAKEVEMLFGCEDLAFVHKQIAESYSMRTVENDDKTKYHNIFYDKLRTGWYDFMFLYYRLINEIKNYYNIEELIVFQKTPSIRFHLPGNLAVGEFHSDSQYNHLNGELNVSVPLTDSLAPRAILIETGSGPEGPIFTDMACEFGELAVFNGNSLLHGNRVNDSERTRVSFDFRLLTKSGYDREAGEKCSFGQNMPFEMGGYYSRYTA